MHQLIRKSIVTVILTFCILTTSAYCHDLNALLEKGPPPIKSCLQDALDRNQVDHLWQLLKKINGQHKRLFQLHDKLPHHTQIVPASDYGKVFPYKFSCSELEKILFYCLDRFQKDKAILVQSIVPVKSFKAVKIIAKKHTPAKPRMTGPVKKVMIRMLIFTDLIHIANCQLIYGKILVPDKKWPSPSIEQMDLSATAELLIQKLEIIAQDNQHIIANFKDPSRLSQHP